MNTLILIILLLILVILIIINNWQYKQINEIKKSINNIYYDLAKDKYKYIIDVCEKSKCTQNSILCSIQSNNDRFDKINNIINFLTEENNKKLNKIYNFICNLQLDINNKHDHICDNKLSRIILNTNTVKECVKLISNNTDKLIKSLEAKNSLCKCETNKSSSKKKKEEKQANNS